MTPRAVDPLIAELVRRRHQLGVAQRVLARAAGYASPSTFSWIEAGRRTPNLDLLNRWVATLGGQLHIVWLDEDGTGVDDPDDLPGKLLTPAARRQRLLQDVARGRTPGDTAARAAVSQRTVHRHVAARRNQTEVC